MTPAYAVLCTQPGCPRPAAYKIAARWSDGSTEELKTYALCCGECLAEAYRASRAKQAACRTAKGETLEAPATALLLELPGEEGVRVARARVVHATSVPGGTFLVGCTFDAPLSDAEVQMLAR